MKYRADIDGLRAVAVGLVVAFHADLKGVNGGFIGVDVFFVISGFLIAQLIAGRQAAGDFSLVDFWERRVRRLMPALFVVLAVSSVLAWVLLLPADLESYARSQIAALLSVANLYFWRSSGYFAGIGLDKPLLHTWSLGVEEQFYLVFPAFMLAAALWFPKRRNLVLVGIFVLSFLLSVWMAFAFPEAAFYLPVTRAWELLAGVLLALRDDRPAPAIVRRFGGLLGLAMIVASALLYNEETPFPGLSAALPVGGTALVIAAGGEGLSGRLLRWKPAVFVGLISYSLYLWHWPVLVFARAAAPIEWGWPAASLAVAVSVVLAVLSWRFVEQPFRDRARFGRRTIFGLAALVGGALALIAASALVTRGYPQRFDAVAQQYGARVGILPVADYRLGTCHISTENPYGVYRFDECLKRDPARPDWLLVGDSHGAHLWRGLQDANPELNIMQATAGGCRMTLERGANMRDVCLRLADYVYGDLIAKTPPDGVVLASRWRASSLPGVEKTLDLLKARGVPVVLVGPVPQYDDALPRLLALSRRLNDPGLPNRRRLHELKDLDRRMAAMAREKGVPYVSLFRALCPDGPCRTEVSEGVPVQFDYGHLTAEGSRLLAMRLRENGDFPVR